MEPELGVDQTCIHTRRERSLATDRSLCTQFWDQVSPWLLAGLVAVGYSVIAVVPKLSGKPSVRYAFPFTSITPVSESARALVESAALWYWGLGLVLARSALSGASASRQYFGRVLVTIGTGILGFVLPLLAFVWILAAMEGEIPGGPWGVTDGNHGPWRQIPDLRRLLHETLLLPGYSLLLGRASTVIQSSRAGWYVIGGSILVFFVLVASHHWLID